MASSNGAMCGEKISTGGGSRLRNLLEIAIAYGLILLVIWTPRPWQTYLWWTAAAGVASITCISFDGFQAMGLRATNFGRSLWIVGAALLVAGAAVLVALRLHTLHLPGTPLAFALTYCAYAIWCGVQQFLLQAFFLQRILRLIPYRVRAVLAAAVVFAAAHLPSPILTPLTLVWGIASSLIFLRYRNLYSLALAHAILGITIAMTIPGPVDHNMRVGLGYLMYNPHQHGHRPYPVEHPLPKP